jgi:5'-nucleotidase
MKMQTLAIDMDETIADTLAKFVSWYQRDFGVAFSSAQLQGKEISSLVPPERRGIFLEYLNTPGFCRDIPVIADAPEVLEKLNQKYEIYICSSAMEFPNSLKDKLEWTLEYFPFLSWKQVCLCGNKHLIQTDIMIDDRSRNFAAFRGRKILFTQNHNFSETGYERAASWKEVATLLL